MKYNRKKMLGLIAIAVWTVLFGLICLSGRFGIYKSKYLRKYPPPKIPTYFIFSRDHEWISEDKVLPAVKCAKKELFGDCVPDYIENIIVIDEGDDWYIYFGLRGNGLLDKPNYKYSLLYEGSLALYINKKTLDICEKCNRIESRCSPIKTGITGKGSSRQDKSSVPEL